MRNRLLDNETLKLISGSDKLPSPYSDVLRFYYKDNLTQKEIAKRMNTSLYKVRWHLSKGMYLLRKLSSANKETSRL